MNEQFTQQMASRLDSVSAKLVRVVRRDQGSDLISPPRLAALAAIVRAGPLSLSALAAAEQVRAPTMSRVVEELVQEGLVLRETVPADRRSVRISATDAGRSLLERAGKQRVGALTKRLDTLAESEKRALLRAVELLERLTRAG
ncbi:MarR family winged helix-turn-helix transcriptional regulator [Sphingomonas sp.]|uniref:MarR family winged helix-turn-helix transcriptional regulator n=1 Tax=Sphingomonas sp. TaxID=28214 RepID=UPI002FC9DCDF